MENEINLLKKYRIGVLAGGSSSEREVSLKSGRAVFDALQGLGLTALFIDVDEDDFAQKVGQAGIDTAFIALHGRFGEDGTVQRLLEEKNIVYTGSGPEASRLALDKVSSKTRFNEKNLPTPEYKVIKIHEKISCNDVWYPCIVKPRSEGSSIGLSLVFSRDHLEDAVLRASLYGEDVIIERFIEGKEITVGIIEDRALPVVEIIPAKGHYDYDAKYSSVETRYIVPARISEDYTKSAQEIAVGAYTALGCEEFARVDMRLSNDGKLYILEVNTIPGLTERSLLPMAANAAGMDFPDLCVKILLGAVNKKKRG
ncbi:MAG: D-alanine--D-alanine ligase, partial [Candidatus Omnitrophota bacterium]